MGASLSWAKVAVLKFFGSRCAWDAKIHRGVYFKNPWNVVIRKDVEIHADVFFDTPSQELVIGAYAKIGARCYLATARVAPASWRIDAVNSRITIPPSSRISEGSIILPELK
jgi:acetyltransferase-like isoleucine patch superfamily enzyme